MKIIFIGFMGAGKSFFAKRLAKRLGLEMIEMDELILGKSGRVSIGEIFNKDDEIKFRELEIETAKELQEKDNVVIDAGGGVVENKIILDYLRKNGIVIFLNSPLEIIEKRLKDDQTRPLFKDKEKSKRLYEFRMPLYRAYSDVIIDTGEITFFNPNETERILDNIVEKINTHVKSPKSPKEEKL